MGVLETPLQRPQGSVNQETKTRERVVRCALSCSGRGACPDSFSCGVGSRIPGSTGHLLFLLPSTQVEGPGLSGNDICPPGFFCPMGTGFPLPCPPGFYSSTRGLNSKDQCQPCPSGHYCSQPGLAQVLETSICHAG